MFTKFSYYNILTEYYTPEMSHHQEDEFWRIEQHSKMALQRAPPNSNRRKTYIFFSSSWMPCLEHWAQSMSFTLILSPNIGKILLSAVALVKFKLDSLDIISVLRIQFIVSICTPTLLIIIVFINSYTFSFNKNQNFASTDALQLHYFYWPWNNEFVLKKRWNTSEIERKEHNYNF